MSKFLKLLGHYIRHPVDFLLLPVSIIFGYLHGLIKAKAMLSLNVVSQHAGSLPAGNNIRFGKMVGDASVQCVTDNLHTDCVGHP